MYISGQMRCKLQGVSYTVSFKLILCINLACVSQMTTARRRVYNVNAAVRLRRVRCGCIDERFATLKHEAIAELL